MVRNLRRNGNFIFGICLCVIALLLYFFLVPAQTTSYVTRVGFGARTFPRFALISISILSLIMSTLSYFHCEDDLRGISKNELKWTLQLLAVLIAAALSIDYLGLYLAFGLGIFVIQWVLGARKLAPMFLGIFSFLLMVYLILELGLKLRLPRGIFGQLF